MSEDTAVVEDTETKTTKSRAKPKSKQKSYFDASRLHRFFLDDGESWIEHQQLDEGLYEEYQDLTSSIKLDREGETTEVDMALGKTRKFLLERLVLGWNLVDGNGDPIQFTPKKLRELPPHIIGDLLRDIYESNPILSGEDEDSNEAGKDT